MWVTSPNDEALVGFMFVHAPNDVRLRLIF